MIAHFFKEADVTLLQAARATIERCLREGKHVDAQMGDGDIMRAVLSHYPRLDDLQEEVKYLQVFYGEKISALSYDVVQPEYFRATDFEGAAKAMIVRMASQEPHKASGLGINFLQILKEATK